MIEPQIITQSPSPQDLDSLKTVALAVYVLQALSFFWGMTAVRRAHRLCQARRRPQHLGGKPFALGNSYLLLGAVLVRVRNRPDLDLRAGLLVLAVVYFWTIYRAVKGWPKPPSANLSIPQHSEAVLR